MASNAEWMWISLNVKANIDNMRLQYGFQLNIIYEVGLILMLICGEFTSQHLYICVLRYILFDIYPNSPDIYLCKYNII